MSALEKPVVEIGEDVGQASGDFIGDLAAAVRDALEDQGLPSEEAFQAIRAASTGDQALSQAENYVRLRVVRS